MTLAPSHDQRCTNRGRTIGNSKATHLHCIEFHKLFVTAAGWLAGCGLQYQWQYMCCTSASILRLAMMLGNINVLEHLLKALLMPSVSCKMALQPGYFLVRTSIAQTVQQPVLAQHWAQAGHNSHLLLNSLQFTHSLTLVVACLKTNYVLHAEAIERHDTACRCCL